MTDTTATPPAPTPGYKTTEFWLKIAAFVMTALFASGVIPTSGPLATAMAIGATMLGALGYTVGRSLVKAAAAALVLMALGTAVGSLTACTASTLGAATEKALVNCTGTAIGTTPGLNVATLTAVANAIVADRSKCTPVGGSIDWTCVEQLAITDGEVIGGCALVQLVGTLQPAKATSTTIAATALPDPAARAVLEDFRAKVAGGATFHTASGDW
jgi:hypothetical protein